MGAEHVPRVPTECRSNNGFFGPNSYVRLQSNVRLGTSERYTFPFVKYFKCLEDLECFKKLRHHFLVICPVYRRLTNTDMIFKNVVQSLSSRFFYVYLTSLKTDLVLSQSSDSLRSYSVGRLKLADLIKFANGEQFYSFSKRIQRFSILSSRLASRRKHYYPLGQSPMKRFSKIKI